VVKREKIPRAVRDSYPKTEMARVDAPVRKPLRVQVPTLKPIREVDIPRVKDVVPTIEPALPPAAKPPVAAKTAEIFEMEMVTSDDPDCREAESEAVRARNARSDADRLFYLRRALRLCPAQASYHLEIGVVYASIGRTDDARFEFRETLDLDPGNPEAGIQLSKLDSE